MRGGSPRARVTSKESRGAAGPLPLVGGEGAPQALHLLGGRIEADRPDVDLAGPQLQPGARGAGREAGHHLPESAEAETSARSRATASRIRSLALWTKKWSPGSMRARNRPRVCRRQASRSSRVTSSSPRPPKAESAKSNGSSAVKTWVWLTAQ